MQRLTDRTLNDAISAIRTDSCVFISSTFTYPWLSRILTQQKITRSRLNKCIRRGTLPDPKKHHTWIVPIHDAYNEHWTVAVLFAHYNAIVHYDSLWGKVELKECSTDASEKLAVFARAVGFFKEVPSMYGGCVLPCQQDSVSCGYYVARLAWLFRLCTHDVDFQLENILWQKIDPKQINEILS